MKKITLIILLIASITILAQKKLSYEQVYLNKGERLTNRLPMLQGWFDDNFYLEMTIEKGQRKTVKVSVDDGSSSELVDYSALDENLPEGFSTSTAITNTDDFSVFVFEKENDIYYFKPDEELFVRVTDDGIEKKNVRLSPDTKKIAYTKENNLFAADCIEAVETQLTFDGTELIMNGYASWVYYEEILGRSSRYAAFWWAPNSEMLAYLRFDDSPVPEFPIFRHIAGKHGELEKTRYPKAGDPLPFIKLGIAHLDNGKTTWVDLEENADHMVAWPFWTPDNKQLYFQWLNRGQDNLKIFAADAKTGAKKEIYDEKQPSWVEFFEDIYFFEDGSGFMLRSDKSGYRHLYRYTMDGELINQITDGEWEVKSIELVDEENDMIYFSGWTDESTGSHLYKVNFDGGNFEKLTKEEGTHRVTISPGGKYFYSSFSNLQTPTKLRIFNTNGDLIKELGDAKSEVFDEYDLGKTELFRIPIQGYDLPAYWFLPPNFDENKKYPILFSIYGGPNAGTVRNSFPWSMNNFYYAQEGIIVISVDHRASGHFGKKGVSEMHRSLGKWEMHDIIEAVKWLKQKPFIDSTKIGMTGGSYGGYFTALALTLGADYFTHGIASFPVTDWQLYDNVYTERYMDTPEENPEGYEYGSIMTHAENYKGKLLLVHGTMDDNVHVQNTIQLVDKFIDLNKDFEMMLYPGERHGWRSQKRFHSTREANQFWFKYFLNREIP
ncbi:MAG: S9 family peptidase [Melioribacteraceae bacterium]|nr:S9 family peptidase [Melioribacteraceae bacterium]